MNVLIINTYYSGGGAERVARQLFYGLKGDEISTFFLAGRLQKNIPKEIGVIYSSFISRCITSGMGIPFHNTLFYTLRAKNKIIDTIKEKKIDIVHFHNIHSNYLGINDIADISKYCKAVVFTLHDMWLLTGGCTHAMDCVEWKNSGCRNCQGNIVIGNRFAFAGKILVSKKNVLAGKNYYFTVPSEWLYNLCKESYLEKERISVIYNGVNLDTFKMKDKNSLRIQYQIPENRNIIVFAANGANNVFKGFSHLLRALEKVKNKKQYLLLIIGNHEKLNFCREYEIREFGYVRLAEKLNDIYALADIYITPSLADTFPLTSLEAMASGTPVLAYATGGICELVNELSGWLVESGNIDALGKKLQEIFEHKETLIEKSLGARQRAETLFSEKKMLEQYKRLYQNILERDKE